jgi:hypothetical protein
MQVMENSQRPRRSVKLADVGRPRTRPAGETLSLGIKVDPKLVDLLDKEAKIMSAEQPPGRAAISRGELIRIALHEWLAARAKARGERQQ